MNKEVQALLALIKDKSYRNLVFDMDETITRLDVPWREWKRRVVEALSPEMSTTLEHVLSLKGVALNNFLNEQMAADSAFYKRYIQTTLEFETEHFAHTPYQDLVEVLPTLKDLGCTLFIWTGNTRPTAERALLELGIFHLFTKILTREDTKMAKPHPEGWSLLNESDEPLKSYLFIGDSQNDELAAKGIGIRYFPIKFFK